MCVNNLSATEKSLKIQSFHPPVVLSIKAKYVFWYNHSLHNNEGLQEPIKPGGVRRELDETKPVSVGLNCGLNSNLDDFKMACLKSHLIWRPSIKACSPKDISKLICKSTIFNISWEKCQWVLSSRIIREFQSILISVRLTYIIGKDISKYCFSNEWEKGLNLKIT